MIFKFITKTVLITILFVFIIFIGLIMSTEIVKKRKFNNYNTESNTLFLGSNDKYDIMFMGISHARNFSRHKNHLKVESILNSKIVNIGQGNGTCGVNEQLFYLKYFFKKGNSVSKIVFVITPPMLYSNTLPIASNTFNNEAFEIQFFKDYLSFKSENKFERIVSYLQTKLHPFWLMKQPYALDEMEKTLDSLNMNAVSKGQNLAYGGLALNTTQFVRATEAVEKLVLLSKQKDIKVILLIPPTLFGKWRGHEQTLGFAEEMKNKYPNVEVFDGSETELDPNLYYDNHHLNTAGVVSFTEMFLKPILQPENKARTHNNTYK